MSRLSILRRRPSWWRRLLGGEISILRAGGFVASPYFTPYTLDSSRVDYGLARALYRNTDDRYKLGAGFCRPIINTTAGFMGTPHFTHPDPDADQALEAVFSRWTGKVFRINRNALRDGDVFARILRVAPRFGRGEGDWELRLIPPEWVTPVVDPITGGWQQLIIRYPGVVTDDRGQVIQRYTVTEILTPKTRTIEADSRAPADVQAQNTTEPNPWGFIPVVHFKNEAEETELYGASDLEPVEPFVKAYHDVMLFAVQGSRLFSRPKAKFKLKDVQRFLSDNFSAEEVRSGRLRFADKEIFLLQEGDDAAFITADSGLEGITTLLKFLFFCIVDVSETPEFAFGTAVSSSKASVSEQMVPLARKIRRKRGQFEEPYGELASMFLAMWSTIEGRKLDTYQADIGWEEISPRDDSEVATTVKTLVEGLAQAVESGLMSQDAAAEFLREFVPTMLPWVDPDADDDERRRVTRTMLLLRRLEDGQGLDAAGGSDEDEEL
ncbi:phage portal protein [Thermaerobacter composti]|uniref:Phage portal protein n=1 Tax=Thermaerobacter composti TaxID=554949 RepID=A0ABZ0QRR9_9FIRM|nr:phage portal protein [Thermaerobacter composti]WPD20190.1 phage portal protein [Thermaerobacter composti]